MKTARDYLREIHRAATDDGTCAEARVGTIRGILAFALGDDEAIRLDDAAHESATRHSYGSLADHNEHVAFFKLAAAGEDCEPLTTSAVEGFAAGRLHRHRAHGGGRASASVMGATMATDSIEMPAEVDGISARRAS